MHKVLVLLSFIVVLSLGASIPVPVPFRERSNSKIPTNRVGLQATIECPNVPSTPGDRRYNKERLRVASFNVEWLFTKHTGASSTTCPGTGCPWEDEAAAILHLKNVARAIYDIDADIVNLLEVEDCYVLNQLIKEYDAIENGYLNHTSPYSRAGRYVPYLLTGTDTATGQNAAMITRVDPVVNLQRTSARIEYPIPGSQCFASAQNSKSTLKASTSAVSKHYYTTFEVEGIANPILVIGAHLLAYPDDQYRCEQREAQASVLQGLALAEGVSQKKELIIMGDLNDFDPALVDPANSQPISQVLDILKHPRGVNSSQDVLYNSVAGVILTQDRYSAWWDRDSSCTQDEDNELSLIDHILISQGLKSHLMGVNIYHEYKASCGSYMPDHWPLVIDLNTSQ